MNSKQKLSFWAALLLPVFACAAFLLYSPRKVSACEFYYPCSGHPTECEGTYAGCFSGHSNGVIFCKNELGQCNTGPGTCNNGCVTCEYGGC